MTTTLMKRRHPERPLAPPGDVVDMKRNEIGKGPIKATVFQSIPSFAWTGSDYKLWEQTHSD